MDNKHGPEAMNLGTVSRPLYIDKEMLCTSIVVKGSPGRTLQLDEQQPKQLERSGRIYATIDSAT